MLIVRLGLVKYSICESPSSRKAQNEEEDFYFHSRLSSVDAQVCRDEAGGSGLPQERRQLPADREDRQAAAGALDHLGSRHRYAERDAPGDDEGLLAASRPGSLAGKSDDSQRAVLRQVRRLALGHSGNRSSRAHPRRRGDSTRVRGASRAS